VQELLGHESLDTTAIYVHADAAQGVSPMDCQVARRSLVELANH
jgi:site-specific recombinase XerC